MTSASSAARATPALEIDLNADLGESFGQWRLGDDDAMLDVVSSANVACGFHAGDPAGIRRTVRAAVAKGVAIGAHPGYRDLAGFGRRAMDVESSELEADVLYQLGALHGLAHSEGGDLAYVKPHGALYNTIARDRRQADAVLAAIAAFDAALPLVALAGSPLVEWASEAGLRTIEEAFVDRAYLPDGALVPRRDPRAVIHDPGVAAERTVRMVEEGVVEAVDGSLVRVDARSVCVHGDSPAAVEMARATRQALERAGIRVRAFAAGGPAPSARDRP